MKSGLIFGMVLVSIFALTLPLLVDWHPAKGSNGKPEAAGGAKEEPGEEQSPIEFAKQIEANRASKQEPNDGKERELEQKEQAESAARSKIPLHPASAERKQRVKDLLRQLQELGDRVTVKDAQSAVRWFSQLDEDDLPFAQETWAKLGKIMAGAADKNVAAVAKSLDAALRKFTMVGTRLEITGRTTDGQEFDLENLKGKVVLVDFWATWCGPCIAEIPNIIKAHAKYRSRGFAVIGVSLDRNNEAITKFADARKLPWSCINVQDSRKLANRYGVNAIPQPVLIGRDGRIVSMRARGPELERLLARLISESQ